MQSSETIDFTSVSAIAKFLITIIFINISYSINMIAA